jgi:hypothetical protein
MGDLLLPLSQGGEIHATPYLAVLLVATLGTAVLLGLAIGAFAQRQSRSYLLIVGALGALLGRSAVAAATMTGLLSPAGHHFIEHAFDVLLVGFVIAAIYHARANVPPTETQ